MQAHKIISNHIARIQEALGWRREIEAGSLNEFMRSLPSSFTQFSIDSSSGTLLFVFLIRTGGKKFTGAYSVNQNKVVLDGVNNDAIATEVLQIMNLEVNCG